MKCTKYSCLDKPQNTKVVIGSEVKSLDEFDDLVNKDERIKEKMKKVEEKLKNY